MSDLPVFKKWEKFQENLGGDFCDEFLDFSNYCEERIREGAKLYGDSWKKQDNLKEAQEETADLFNYCYLEIMKYDLKPKDGEKYWDLVEIGRKAFNLWLRLQKGTEEK